MAKFGEKVFEFKEVLESCKIPVSMAGDQWFVNVGKNSVVNVHDQKTLHTWTLMHPHYFTCSVVHLDGCLYCIMDKNVLLKWSVEEDNLKNAEKIKFDDNVFTIIPINGAQPLIIFESGKYAIITRTFYDVKPSEFMFLKENEELIWADACVSATDVEMFCLVHNEKEKYRILYNFTMNETCSVPHIYSHKLSHHKAVLKSWCLNHHDSLFLSLWSDGMICSHNIKESKDTDLFTVKGMGEEIVTDIENIDSTHISVAKARSKQQECILEIWDSKCAVLKAKKVLKASCINNMQIAAMGSNILISCNKELKAFAFHVEDPTLFAVLGMSESNKRAEISWKTDLEVVPLPTDNELEAMDVSSNLDSSDSLEFIIEKFVNRKSPDLMCIPEAELIELLQLAIRHSKKENCDKESVEKNIYVLLNIIFSASFNDVLLVKELKKLNLDESLVVLKWLLSFFNHSVNMPSSIFERPSDLQIVSWTCLIIQSHTEALLFSKDKSSRKLLKQFEKALSVKMEECEDFDCIQSYFSILEKKDILPQKCSVGKYHLETIGVD